jgi:hypothetical protein
MKRSKRSKKTRLIRLWTRDQAQKAVPYVRSLVHAIREDWLELNQARRRTELLTKGAEPPAILDRRQAYHAQDEAEQHLKEDLAELTKIDVYLADPTQGVAMIPFAKEDNLAWFVFDQFDNQGLVAWRYHTDAVNERRELALLDAPATPTVN